MRYLIATAMFAFLTALAPASSAQGLATQIVGAWKWTGHVYKEVATGKTTNVYGERPLGLMVLTAGGNLVWAVFADSRKAPAGAPVTDAERASLFNTMAAATGTYKVDGNTLALTYNGSWNQSWTGNDPEATDRNRRQPADVDVRAVQEPADRPGHRLCRDLRAGRLGRAAPLSPVRRGVAPPASFAVGQECPDSPGANAPHPLPVARVTAPRFRASSAAMRAAIDARSQVAFFAGGNRRTMPR